MRVYRYFPIPRPALAVLVAMGAAAAMAVPTSSALAACATTGVAPATVTVTCAANTVTTNTTNSTSPATTSDRIQSFNADLLGQVNSGVTVSGSGLELHTTKANGSVSLTNSGTISLASSNAVVLLTGNGGGVSYSGNGNVTGTAANTSGLDLVDNGAGIGAVTVNATGGSITAVGNSVFGLGVFSNDTGGINITTSGGHSIDLVDTFAGSGNRGMYVNNNGASGDIVIVSGSHIFASGASSFGNILGMDVNQAGAGNINVTSNGVIDLSGTTQTGSSGIFLAHLGTSGNIAANINANIIAGTGGSAGIQATFSNAGNSGTAGFTIANGVTISGGVALRVDGGAGTHAVTVTTGTGSMLSGNNEAIRITGAQTNLALTNVGSLTSVGSTAVNVAGHLIGSNSGSITGVNGILASSAGSNFINAGVITGTGGSAIQFIGAGNVLTLQNGTNITGNVDGGTAATFQLGGTTGSPSFNVSTIGAQYLNFSTFNKIDAGVWTLTGSNAAVMPWTVSGGTLNVNSTMANSTMTVNSGTLGGTGTVGNTQINAGGTFAPGSGVPASSMTVSGSLTLASSAFYMVQISPSTSSFANVTGTATLGGATVNAVFAAGSYVAKQYTILTAANVSGTFNPALANTNLPSGFNTTLSYDPTHAFLNLALNLSPPGGGGGLNGNQQNVANALTNFFNTNGGIPMVFGSLTTAGLTQAAGETATGTQQTTFNAMSQFMGLLTDPFIAGRGDGAAGGAGATPFAEESDGANAYEAKDKPRTSSERDAYAAIYRKAPPPAADPFAQRWSIWAAGYGGSQTTDGNAVLGSNTATSRIFGTAVGADYRFSPSTLAGFALAGGGTNFSIANALGTGRSDLFQAGAYLRHTAGPAYISAALAYGWQDITTDRTVTIAGVDQLRAKFNANAFSGRAEGGYRFLTPWMGVTPYAAAQFTTFDLPAYAERRLSAPTPLRWPTPRRT